MEWITNQVRKRETKLYFASLRSRNKHFYDWVVSVHPGGGYTIKAIREKPEELNRIVAKLDYGTRNGIWCSLQWCRDDAERNKLLEKQPSDYMEVIDLWEEKTETILTTNTITQRKRADE